MYSKGFHIHITEPEKKEETDYNEETTHRTAILKNIGQYLVRTPLSESRIIDYNKDKSKVVIKYKLYEFDYDGKLKKKKEVGLETLDPLELMARLSLYVPVPGKHKILYYGAYSSRFRGTFRQFGHIPNKQCENKKRSECSRKWRELIHLVYQDDPLECPNCGKTLELKDLISPYDAKRVLKDMKIKKINHLYYRYSGNIKKETINTS